MPIFNQISPSEASKSQIESSESRRKIQILNRVRTLFKILRYEELTEEKHIKEELIEVELMKVKLI